ncbi:MAG: hypothetical protein C0605_08570 [Hyphomicrobiales bacterium]|nr:MAG: hypothetical protein C0605_08570 [Hyphomicrobiales bacterium]
MKFRLLIIFGLATLMLAGCGRKGPLEMPEGATPPDRDRPFVLDPLVKPGKAQ